MSAPWPGLPNATPPPHTPADLTAERLTLGAALHGNRHIIDDITTIVTGADMYAPRHETILDAITSLYSRGDPIDPTTTADHLRRTGNLARAGGLAYLHELTTGCPNPESGPYHARIVADTAQRRTLHTAATHIANLALTPTDEPTHTLYARALERLTAAQHSIPGINPDDTTHASTWTPVDLAPILTGDHTTPTAELSRRRDGKMLLYPGTVSSIAGEPGSMKTWYALITTAQELENAHPVLYIDFEDRAVTIVSRLLGLGVDPTNIAAHLRYIRPEVALGVGDGPRLLTAATDATLAVIDGITEAMTLHGLSLLDNEDVARWLQLIPRYLANTGPAVLQVDHVTKNAETRGRFALGGQHKLAGVDGMAYKAVITKPGGKGEHGVTKIVIDKDKHGDVGPSGAVIAELHLDATNIDGTLAGWLDLPSTAPIDEETGEFRPTKIMEKISRMLEVSPGMTGYAIRGARLGKKDYVDKALNRLILEGFLATEEGPRNATKYRTITRYREAEDDDA